MARHPVLAALVLLVLLIPKAQSADATIAVAANFRHAAEQLLPLIEADTGHSYRLVTASTGKLAAQIINGAPYDVLMAADVSRPQALVARGLAAPEDLQVYALGRLALWQPGATASPGLESLRELGNRRLAIANPRLAPYGAAAQSLLTAEGLWRSMGPKTVVADNVAAAYALVRSGSAQLGLIALATLLAADVSRSEYWIVPRERHTAIAQGVLLLGRAEQNPAARAWFSWVLGDALRTRLPELGYERPAGDAAP